MKTFEIMLKTLMDVSNPSNAIGKIQKQLNSLKLPNNLNESFRNNFSQLDQTVLNVQKRLNAGFKTKGDVSGLEKDLKKVDDVISDIINDYNKLDSDALKKSLDISGLEEFKRLQVSLKQYKEELNTIKNSDSFKNIINQVNQLSKVTRAGALKQFTQNLEVGNITEAAKALEILKSRAVSLNSEKLVFGSVEQQRKYNNLVNELVLKFQQLTGDSTLNLQGVTNGLSRVNTQIENLRTDRFNTLNTEVGETRIGLDGLQREFRETGAAAVNSAENTRRMTSEMDHLTNQVQAFFGVSNTIEIFKRTIRSAFETVKELDKAMTETAVVTDFSVGDMWEALPRYTAAANELGTTTLGAYETMTLYYQQGLKTNEVFEIGTETMKMARIAGMDYTKATDLMTAALRGFNMELNEVSAQRINDVYSELAAITAADTEEIADAMTRTASIANSAGMGFETTSAFLSQMIETTREAPENLGTAMKTIIARFQELKKAPSEIIDVDGEEVSLNKIDTALKSIGVTLTDTSGQFRNLDEVFIEIASKWDNLDKNTQRYIATVAAGSRQQSRFIAMMSNYDRTMELVDAANNSAGASQKQFEKTTESLESKLNKLKNAWNEFAMGIANNKLIKFGVDALTELFGIINKITDVAGDGVGTFLKLGAAILTLKAGKGILSGILGGLGKAFGQGALSGTGIAAHFNQAGQQAGEAYGQGLNNSLNKISFQAARQAKALSNRLRAALIQNNNELDVGTFTNIFTKIPQAIRQEMLASAPNILDPFINSVKNQLLNSFPNMGGESADKLMQIFKQHLIARGGDIDTAIELLNEQIRQRFGNTKFDIKNLKIDPSVINGLSSSFNKLGNTVGNVGNLFTSFSNILRSMGLEGAANAVQSLGMTFSSLSGIIVSMTLLFPKLGASGLLAGSEIAAAGHTATAGWAAFMPIILAVGAAIAVLSFAIKSNEEKIESMNEHLDEFNSKIDEIDSNIDSIKNLRDEFENLSEGVDDAGENIGLSIDEFERYHEIVDELIKINPELVQGYDDEGNAIIDRNTAIQEGIKLQQEYREEAIRSLISDDSISDIIDGVQASIDEIDMPDFSTIPAGAIQSIKNVIPDFDYSNMSNEDIEEIYKNKEVILKQAKENLENTFSGEPEKAKEYFTNFSNIINNNLANYIKNINDAKQPLTDALTQWATLDDAIEGKSLFDFIPEDMAPMLQEGIKLVTDQVANGEITFKEAQNSLRDYSRELSNLGTENSKYKEAVDQAENAQEKFLKSSRDTEAINNYEEAVKGSKKAIIELAEEYEAKGDEMSLSIARSLRDSASSIELFARNSQKSLEEAINPFASLMKTARQAKEEFDAAVEGNDYYVAQDQYKEIYDQIYDEDSIDAQGAGSKSFWQAAKQILGEDTLKELKYDFTQVNDQLKDYKKFSDKGIKSTDSFYKLLLKEKVALKAVGVTVKQNDLGQISFEGLTMENITKVANALNMSEEYLSSILDGARQFSSINFDNVNEVKEALQRMDTTFSNNGKVFQLYNKVEAEAGAAGINPEEFKNVYTEKWEKEGVVLLNLEDEATEVAKVFSQMGESFSKFNKTSGQWVVNGDEIIARLYQMGATSEETEQTLQKLFDDDEKIKLNIGTNEDELSSYISDAYAEYDKLNTESDPFSKMTSSTENLTDAINNLIIAMGGIPSVDFENQAGSLEKEVDKAGQKFNNKQLSEEDQSAYLSNYKTRLSELQDEISKLQQASDNATDKAVKDKLDGQIEEYTKRYNKIKGKIDKLFKPSYSKLKGGLKTTIDNLGLENFSNKKIEKIIKIKTQYDEDKDKNKTLEKLLNSDLEDEQVIRIATAITGYKTTQKELDNIKAKSEFLNKIKPNVKITANGKQSKKEIEAVKKEAEEFAEKKYLAVLEADGSDADAAAEATSAYITTLASKGYSFKINSTGLDSILDGLSDVAERARNAAREVSKISPGPTFNRAKVYGTEAKGTNNKTYSSAAGGKLGPDGKGGLTLTGELGPEVVWLPSDNSSMIVGMSGPEMVNLPSDAVVYTAEQSKRILKGPKLSKYTFKSAAGGTYDPVDPRPNSPNPSKPTTKPSQKPSKSKNKDDDKDLEKWRQATKKNTDSTEENTKKLNEVTKPLDRLYNTLRYIDKELRMVNKYQERYERLLDNVDLTGKDLIKNLQKQTKQYNLIIERSKYGKTTRQSQIKNRLNKKVTWEYEKEITKDGKKEVVTKKKTSKKELDYWLNYNKKLNLVTVDQKRLNKLKNSKVGSDRALYNHIIDEILPDLEGWQSDIEEMNDNIEDATNAMEDMKKIGKESLRNIEDRVYQALVQREQKKIDKLSQIDDSINSANQDMINTIQDNLSKIRQDRQNQETEEDIAAKERRLAYLRRDTSNANALEIKQLEEELANQKQDYTDTLIDQKVSELQEQNELASEERQQQIDLLQAQLKYDEENGAFWEKAHTLMEEGIDETGRLVETSELVKLLKYGEGFAGLSVIGQMEWYQELQREAAQASIYMENIANSLNKLADSLLYAVQTGEVEVGEKVTWNKDEGSMGKGGSFSGTVMEDGETLYYEGKKKDNVHFEIPLSLLHKNDDGTWDFKDDGNNYSLDDFRKFDIKNESSGKTKKKQTIYARGKNGLVKIETTRQPDGTLRGPKGTVYRDVVQGTNGKFYTEKAMKMLEEQNSSIKRKYSAFKTGGIADFTGPAWLDGTKTKPEMVLNARDTENFIQLKDILRNLLNQQNSYNNSEGGDNYYEIQINVEKLESDYDVDRVAEKVKRIIVQDSKYRNVNVVNRLR